MFEENNIFIQYNLQLIYLFIHLFIHKYRQQKVESNQPKKAKNIRDTFMWIWGEPLNSSNKVLKVFLI